MALVFRIGQSAALIAAAAVLGALCAKWQPSWAVLLVTATAMVLVLALLWRAGTDQLDVFEPLPIFCAVYGVMFVLRPGVTLNDDVSVYELAGVTVGIGDTFQDMQEIALVGALGFVLGYMSRYGPVLAARLRNPRSAHDPAGLGRLGFVVAILGLISVIVFAWTQGGFSALLGGRSETYYDSLADTSKYLYYLPTLLVSAALLSFAAWRGTRAPGWGWIALVAMGGLLAVRGPVGSRLILLPLIGGLLVFLYLRRGTRPSWSGIAVVVVAALVVSTFIGEARNANTGVAGAAHALWSTPTSIFEPLKTGQDAALAPALAAALTVTPTIEHTPGSATVGDLAFRVVPRNVWPEKPKPPREEVVAAIWGPTSYANPEFSALFGFYLEGKLIGVLIGLAFYGLLARTIWEYARRHFDSTAVLIAYAVLLPSMAMFLRDQPTDALARVLFYAGPIVAAIWWVPRPWFHK